MARTRANCGVVLKASLTSIEVPKVIRNLTVSVFWVLSSTTAVAQAPMPQLSSASLGDAKFGMTAGEVERALGRKIVLKGDARKAGIAKFKCGDAGIEGIPGVDLHFEYGRMVAATLSGPPLSTRSGFTVGDPESNVISKFKSDSTYDRSPNQHADPNDKDRLMEITLGSRRFNPRTNQYEGNAVKFTSQRGVVKFIEAGQSSYVLLVEHDGGCD